MRNITRTLTVALLVLSVLVVACTQNQALTLLNTVLNTVDAVFPVIAAAANLNPEVTREVGDYLTQVTQAVGRATTILESPASPSAKAAQIIAIFAAVVQPKLPSGTPQTVIAVIVAVSRAIEDFLRHIRVPPVAPVPPARTSQLSRSDRKLAQKITQRSIDIQMKALELKR